MKTVETEKNTNNISTCENILFKQEVIDMIFQLTIWIYNNIPKFF